MEIFGVLPFDGLAWPQILALFAVYIGAFFLKGIFGYGAVPMMVVGGSLIIPPHHAVVLAAAANFYTQFQLIPQSLREGDRRVAGNLALWVLPAIIAGVWMFTQTDSTRLSLGIGCFILFLVLTDIFGLIGRATPLIHRHQNVAGPIASTISGLIAGFIGAGAVVFISIYVRLLCPEKMQFRGTMVLIGSVFVVWRFVVLVVAGIAGVAVLTEAALLAPLGLVSAHYGVKVVRHIPGPLFFRLYQGILMTAALMLIWQALSG